MELTFTVMKSGNSAVVALPAEWRRKSGVDIGDKLAVAYSDAGVISFSKVDDRRESQMRAFDRLSRRAEALPDIPWDDDSKEADRSLLEERYV